MIAVGVRLQRYFPYSCSNDGNDGIAASDVFLLWQLGAWYNYATFERAHPFLLFDA